MLRLLLGVGWLIWFAVIVASAAINYLAGYQLGRTTEEAHLFAIVGIAADGWKAVGPIFIALLWQARKYLSVALAATVWIACFGVALTAASGLAAQNRGAVITAREAAHDTWRAATQELDALQSRRSNLATVPSDSELQVKIAAVLARPSGERGTVGAVSDDCQKDVWSTRKACAQIAELKVALAQAHERDRLDADISEVRTRLDDARQRGGTTDSDPQAVLIARLTNGFIAVHSVPHMIALLIVAMIELVSAFAPLILTRAVAPRQRKRHERSISNRRILPAVVNTQPTSILDYVLARLRPGDGTQLDASVMFRDYVDWSGARNLEPRKKTLFLAEIDRLISEDLLGRVVRRGTKYHGICFSELASETSH